MNLLVVVRTLAVLSVRLVNGVGSSSSSSSSPSECETETALLLTNEMLLEKQVELAEFYAKVTCVSEEAGKTKCVQDYSSSSEISFSYREACEGAGGEYQTASIRLVCAGWVVVTTTATTNSSVEVESVTDVSSYPGCVGKACPENHHEETFLESYRTVAKASEEAVVAQADWSSYACSVSAVAVAAEKTSVPTASASIPASPVTAAPIPNVSGDEKRDDSSSSSTRDARSLSLVLSVATCVFFGARALSDSSSVAS